MWTGLHPSPTISTEVLTPSVAVFGCDKACWEIIKVKWGRKIVPQSERAGVFLRRGRDTRALLLLPCMCTRESPCEDPARRQQSAVQQGGMSHRTPIPMQQAPELWENRCLWVKPSAYVFCYDGLIWLMIADWKHAKRLLKKIGLKTRNNEH